MHERRHTDNYKTEKCEICSQAFEFKYQLRNHMAKKHAHDKDKNDQGGFNNSFADFLLKN